MLGASLRLGSSRQTEQSLLFPAFWLLGQKEKVSNSFTLAAVSMEKLVGVCLFFMNKLT